MTNGEIFDIFTSAGMTSEGACAVMGNFMAESSMKPNIVQRGMTKLSDEQYTAAVDNGLYDFADGIGYGYAQWTWGPRKRKLLEFAKANGVSIGNAEMQCQFAIKELKEDFHTIWADLCQSKDLFQLTQLICNVYENPAVKNVGTRYEYAKQFYDQMKNPATSYNPKDPVAATFPPDPTVLAFQLWMNYNGYACAVNGYKSGDFFPTLDQFVADMKKC